MPILSEEPSLYPETLLTDFDDNFDDDSDCEPSHRRWWVLYTKARQEKAISRDLLAQQIPFYLPLLRKSSVFRGRNVESYIPLFSGYVFLYGSDEERTRSLITNRISRILKVDDPVQLVHDLRQLNQLIASNAPMTAESRLVAGDRVRVRHGLLTGLEGMVLTRRGRTRLLVSVDFLQQGASVEVEDFLLEPID